MDKLTVVLMSIKRLNKKRRPLMPCSFTGPKMFFASPHFFRQTKNGFTYCASQKHFVPEDDLHSVELVFVPAEKVLKRH